MALPSFRVTELRRRERYPNLLASWGFGEGSGTVARDSSDRGNNLAVAGTLTWPAGHSGGTGLGNAGVTGSASGPWTLSGSAITLMGWVRPLDLTAGATQALFGIWDSADAGGATQVALWAQRGDFGAANVLQGNVRINGGLVGLDGTALTLNTWTHIAFTYDGTTLRLYRDGTQIGSGSSTGALTAGSLAFSVLPTSSNAQADDVRVFSTALSAPQIVELMNTPVAP
ncbi:MAG TPA: LamG domain-containing protein [Candidatus Saccharimonadales bacterium]